MDGGEVLHQALRHAAEPIGRAGELVGDGPLVHGAVEAFHDVERASEHIARPLVPEHLRRPHRRGLERAENLELLLEVVRLEQARFRWTYAQHDVPPVLIIAGRPREREQDRLRRVAELDAVEPFDAHVAGVGELGREPLPKERARLFDVHPVREGVNRRRIWS